MASQENSDVLCEYHKFSDQKVFSFDSYEVGSHIDIATSEEKKNNDKDDDFISELTREMAHFMVLQDDDEDDQFHLSGIGSSDFDMVLPFLFSYFPKSSIHLDQNFNFFPILLSLILVHLPYSLDLKLNYFPVLSLLFFPLVVGFD